MTGGSAALGHYLRQLGARLSELEPGEVADIIEEIRAEVASAVAEGADEASALEALGSPGELAKRFLDAAEPELQPKRAKRTWLRGVVVGVVAAALVVAAGVWLYTCVTSPAYSFRRLVASVSSHDWHGVQRYTVVEPVAGGLWDQVTYALGTASEDATANADAKAAFTTRFATQLRAEVESPADPPNDVLTLMGLTRGTKISSIANDSATSVLIWAEVPGLRSSMIYRMQRYGRHWRLISIEGAWYVFEENPAVLDAVAEQYGFTP